MIVIGLDIRQTVPTYLGLAARISSNVQYDDFVFGCPAPSNYQETDDRGCQNDHYDNHDNDSN